MKAAILGRVAAEQMKAIEEDPADGEVAIAVTIAGINTGGGPAARVRSNCDPLQRLMLLSQAQQAVLAEMMNQSN
jgi:hypothetical protein